VEEREGISSGSALREIGSEVLWKLSKPEVPELLSTVDLNRECGS
jgi:hypothetical protein